VPPSEVAPPPAAFAPTPTSGVTDRDRVRVAEGTHGLTVPLRLAVDEAVGAAVRLPLRAAVPLAVAEREGEGVGVLL